MPKSPKHFAVARQWQILQIVPVRPPGISARQIVGLLEDAGISVSKRTVERDLNELSLVFDLCNETKSNDGTQGWYFATNRVPTIGSIDHLDAVLLVLAGEVLDQMLPTAAYGVINSRIEKARDKLKGMRKVPLSNWVEKVRYVPPAMVHQRPEVDPEVLRCVQQALVQERQIVASYAPFGRRPATYRLHPLALVLRGPVLYLVASTFDYTKPLLYGLHRMHTAQLSEASAVVPEGFSLTQFLNDGAMDFWIGKKIRLRARLSEQLAQILRESPVAPNQRLHVADGQTVLSATVRESWQLNAWILSHGPDLVVLEPEELRQSIRQRLSSARQQYDDL
jgi:predicted DNA-binding transcriptional regulator YafY